MNKKGFTLIELLAVITIMGILMLVAIPAVSRTIENSRRDTFADNVATYINTVRNAVLADELKCGTTTTDGSGNKTFTTTYNTVSATPDGTYYVVIDTTSQNTQDMMESVAKSSWGNAELKGYVAWAKDQGNTSYYAFISDVSGHGMAREQAELEIGRSTVYPNITAQRCGGTDSDPVMCTGANTTGPAAQKVSGATQLLECVIK